MQNLKLQWYSFCSWSLYVIQFNVQQCCNVSSTLYLQKQAWVTQSEELEGSFGFRGCWSSVNRLASSVSLSWLLVFGSCISVLWKSNYCSSNAGTSSFHGHYKRLMERLSSSLWSRISNREEQNCALISLWYLFGAVEEGRKRAQPRDCNVKHHKAIG